MFNYSHLASMRYAAVSKITSAMKGEFVKARVLLLSALFVGLACPRSIGQINCPAVLPSSPERLPLVCELPISAVQVPSGQSQAQAAARLLSTPINAAIASQLSQLPIPGGTAGTVRILEKGNPAGVPYDNLGPIITDRPETVGKGHLYASFSYQHFNFNAIDGISLGSIPFAYPYSIAPGSISYGTQDSSVSFQLNQYVAQLTYGATKKTDVSFVLPINSVSVGVNNSNVFAYTCDSASGSNPCPYTHGTIQVAPVTGTASGVGDLLFGVKQMIHGADGNPVAISIGLVFRIPSGDYLNYLGSGAYGANIYGLVSYRSKYRVSPHFKLANQWNGPSPLVNTTTPVNTNGEKRLPGGVQYDVGFDAKVVKSVTLAVDILGSQFVNTPALQNSVLTLTPTPSNPPTVVPPTLQTVAAVDNTYTTVNFSGGVKWHPWKNLLVYGNVLVQLNNVGLRSDPVPLGGISYNFGK